MRLSVKEFEAACAQAILFSPSAEDEALEALIKRLRWRREFINRGNGDVQDIPDEDCNLAANRLEALSRQPDRDAVIEALRKENKQLRDDAIAVFEADERIAEWLRKEIGLLRKLKSRPITQPQESKRKYEWTGDGPEPSKWTAPDGTVVYRSYEDYCND